MLVNWLVLVHSDMKLLQETLYMAIAIVDRFLSVRHIVISLIENILTIFSHTCPGTCCEKVFVGLEPSGTLSPCRRESQSR